VKCIVQGMQVTNIQEVYFNPGLKYEVTRFMIKKIISLSLGSSSRDMSIKANFGVHTFDIQRIGMDGSLERLTAEIGKYAADADIITLGGIDINLAFTRKKYIFRDVANILKHYPNIRIVDGERFKEWCEPLFFKKIFEKGLLPNDANVLLPLAANRIPLIKSMIEVGYTRFVFGDFIYDIGFPAIPIKKLETYEAIGYLVAPIITRLPFHWIYPVGEKQECQKIKRPDLLEKAEVIAGDFHNIHIYLPLNLSGKTIVTNTVTPSDINMMKERRLKYLVTLSPSFEGRTFGSNVMDGVITCYLAETGGSFIKDDYLNAAMQLGIQPEIRRFSE